MGRLSALFDPETVAVVGATDRQGAVGRAILGNLQDRYDGGVVPNTPFREGVLGLQSVGAGDLDALTVVTKLSPR